MRTIVNLVLLFTISGLILAQTPDTSLVAYFPFNGNAIDETGNGHNGTVNGGVLTNDRFNQTDKAYTFPNLNNNIVLENTEGLNLENGFTINAWVKYKNINCGIVGKHNCWYVNGFNLGIDNGQFWLVLGNAVWSIVKTNESYIEDQWYMVTGVYDQTNSTGKVYINGVLKANSSVLYNNYSTALITISQASNGCPDGNMPGAIDEVKIYDRPLSDVEIHNEYLSSNGLVTFYPFNGNANDESGNDINPSYIGSGVTLTSDRFGINNRAFYFDGNDGSYIRLPADSLPTTDRTISLWINASDLNGGKVPFSYGGNGCNTSSFIMVQNQSNNSSYRATGHCDQSMITYTYTNQPLNTWKHWVITIKGSTQKLYIDGELKESANNYTGSAYVNGRSGIIGGLIYPDGNTVYADPSAGYFKGKIDDIRIFNYALNDQQVLGLYNDSTTYNPPNLQDGLALFLPFNGNANDESGNNNNGTVNGAQLTQDRFGVNGKAYYFNGSGDFISIADNPNLFSDELTISWWYKITEILGGERVVIGWVDGGHRYQQFFSGGQIAYFNGYNLNQPGVYFNPVFALNDLNVWKNVVVTYKKLSQTTSTTSIYVDGELKQTDNHNLAMDYVPGVNFFIGKNHNGNFFNGYLDDFRIYNRVLNDNEIVALFNDSTTYTPALIDSVYPHQNSNYLTKTESIKIFFSEPMDETTFTNYNLNVHGNLTGKYDRNFIYHSSSNSLEIQPTEPLKYGEQITVTLDSSIRSVSGYNLSPYVFQFNIKPEKGSVKFAVADSFQLDFSPQNIASGDFNNDGKVDVIVSSYDSSKYTILLNNGSGGFALGEEMTGEFKPHSISFTDIDNDRDLDMIVSTNEQNQIRVLRGTGQGTFSWILPYIDANAPVATCPGDFDGDGDNDFVALCNSGNAIFYKNDGTGIFTIFSNSAINTPVTMRNIVGDIDNDGDLDIIGGTSDYWGVFKILINDGTGNFTFTGGPYLGPYPDELAGGDFDGDFDLDFVHCSWYMDGISLILNDGQGNYNDFLNLGNVGGQTRNPVVNDFDGDGDLDFVGVFNNNNIGIARNSIHPSYELSLSYPIPGLKGLTAGDFDNNGSVDLVGISSTTNHVKFIRNISDSLIAYFPFNGNANDESVFQNNGNAINTLLTTDKYANPDAAYYFNGSDSRIYVPENSLYDFGFGDFTITSWVNSSEIKTARIVSAGYDANDNIWGLGFGTHPAWGTGNRICYTVYSNNSYYNFSSDEITSYLPGEWTFLVVTKSSNQINFYKNGLPVGSENISYLSNSNSYLSIGCRQWLSNNLTEFFNGKIDEVKLFNTSFSGQEIWNMYKSTTSAPNLQSPENKSIVNTLTPLLIWDSLVTATNYRVSIATDSLFANVILSQFSNQASYLVETGALNPNVDYYWKVQTNNEGGVSPWSDTYIFKINLTDLEDEKQLPTEFALMQNYPNPFNPFTIIKYQLPIFSHVTLKVYDVLGNEVATLIDESKPAGIYLVELNANLISSGVYLYRLQAGDYTAVRKLILLK